MVSFRQLFDGQSDARQFHNPFGSYAIRPIQTTFNLIVFDPLIQHDDRLRVALPNHPPEVRGGSGRRPLGQYILFIRLLDLKTTLDKKKKPTTDNRHKPKDQL